MSRLFSESNTRYVVEVKADKMNEFASIMRGLPCACIGRVTQETRLLIRDGQNKTVIQAPLDSLKEAWQKPLRW